MKFGSTKPIIFILSICLLLIFSVQLVRAEIAEPIEIKDEIMSIQTLSLQEETSQIDSETIAPEIQPSNTKENYDISKMKEDIKEFERKNNKANIEVNHIVKKFIPIGNRKDNVLEALRKEKFSVEQANEIVSSSNYRLYDELFICSFDYYRGLTNRLFRFNHEIRINLYITDDKISNIEAFVFYKSL